MSVPGPVLGPCTTWISGDDVAACCTASGVGSDTALLDMVAVEASMALYEASGRQFSGLCSATVRPCRSQTCGCWSQRGNLGGYWRWDAGVWWNEDCTERCGCAAVSRIKLAGYPVREIEEVLIDDVVLDPSGYRLDKWRYLVRLDDPGPPVVKQVWPGCQNFSLDSGPGTFFVTYRYGVDPPPLAMSAAAELACQLWLSCPGNIGTGDCKIPDGVTRIDRQGITIDRQLLAGFFDPSKPTGIYSLDLFLAAYCRGKVGYRRPAVWSANTVPYPQRVT